MKPFAPLACCRWRLGLVLALGLALGACQARLEPAPERVAAQRVAQRVAQPASPTATDERQRLFLDGLDKHAAASPERAAFVRAQLQDARFAATAAMHAWASGDAGLADSAYGFLQNVADLALVPAIEQPLPSTPKAAAQGLWLIGDAETELRRKVLQRVNALLADTRELPPEPGQAGAPHRVCDEAYVTLRRLVAFPEPELMPAFVAKLFFASSPATRSALIERVRRTHTWQRILDPNDDSKDEPAKPSSKPSARPHARPQLDQMH